MQKCRVRGVSSHSHRSWQPGWEHPVDRWTMKARILCNKGQPREVTSFSGSAHLNMRFCKSLSRKAFGSAPYLPARAPQRSQATQTQCICWTATVVWCQGHWKKEKKQTLILHKKPEQARERMKLLFLNTFIGKDCYKSVQLLISAQRSPFKTQRWRYAA